MTRLLLLTPRPGSEKNSSISDGGSETRPRLLCQLRFESHPRLRHHGPNVACAATADAASMTSWTSMRPRSPWCHHRRRKRSRQRLVRALIARAPVVTPRATCIGKRDGEKPCTSSALIRCADSSKKGSVHQPEQPRPSRNRRRLGAALNATKPAATPPATCTGRRARARPCGSTALTRPVGALRRAPRQLVCTGTIGCCDLVVDCQ